MTTATPLRLDLLLMVSAICMVSRSWTCRRLRIHVDQAGNLAQADDAAVGNIADVTFAEKRKQVMLAKAELSRYP